MTKLTRPAVRSLARRVVVLSLVGLGVALAIVASSCGGAGSDELGGTPPLELVSGSAGEACMPELPPAGGEVEIFVHLVVLKNVGDEHLTFTGAELVVREGEASLVEVGLLPEDVADSMGVGALGTAYFPWDSKYDYSSYVEARETVPGAVMGPGEAMEFGYHIKARPGSYIDHTELTYEDGSGNQRVYADEISVKVPRLFAGCDAAIGAEDDVPAPTHAG